MITSSSLLLALSPFVVLSPGAQCPLSAMGTMLVLRTPGVV